LNTKFKTTIFTGGGNTAGFRIKEAKKPETRIARLEKLNQRIFETRK